MPLKLPSRADSNRLRAIAKALVEKARQGDEPSLLRLQRWFPVVTPPTVKLSHAQTVLAREYGFSNWPSMISEVELRAEKRKARIARKEQAIGEIQTLANLWFTLAEARDLDQLWQTFGVPLARMTAARELMLKSPARHARFVETLIVGLAHPKPRARFEYAHILDTFGDAGCVEPLKMLLDDDVPRVRWMAMHALTCHGCNPDTCPNDPALLERIAHHAQFDESSTVRRQATIALGLSHNQTVEPVLRHIHDTVTDKRHKGAAAFGLQELGRHVG